MNNIKMKCPSCSAEINFENGQKVLFCSYCGSKLYEEEGTQNINKTANHTYKETDEAAVKKLSIKEKLASYKFIIVLGYLLVCIFMVSLSFVCGKVNSGYFGSFVVFLTIVLISLPLMVLLTIAALKTVSSTSITDYNLGQFRRKSSGKKHSPAPYLIIFWLVYFLILLLIFPSASRGENLSKETKPLIKKESTSNNTRDSYKVYLDFQIMGYERLEDRRLSVCIDGTEVTELPATEYYTKLIEVSKGDHEIYFQVNEEKIPSDLERITSDKDLSLQCILNVDSDGVAISEVKVVDSIADSAITYEDVSEMALQDALNIMTNKHFVDVKYTSNEGEIVNPSDWIVVSQNHKAGDVLDKCDPIELVCRRVYFQLYLDFSFDTNLFLALYNVDLFLDGEKINTIPHGESFTYLTKVREGEHIVRLCKESDSSIQIEKDFNVSTDCTFKGNIHTNRKSIEFNGDEIVDSITGATLEVIDVSTLNLDVAISKLTEIGFSNIYAEPNSDIWIRSNWIVISQDKEPGEIIDKNEKITLNCMKASEYASNNYSSLTIKEIEAKTSSSSEKVIILDYLTSENMATTIAEMDEQEKEKWSVKRTELSSDGTKLYMTYAGEVEVPDVSGKILSTGLEELKKLKMSSIEVKAEDGSVVFDNRNWTITKQSVEAHKIMKADDKITLYVKHNVNTTTSEQKESSSSSSDSVSYSTNDKKSVKNGNKGIYAYERSGRNYNQYYIIDFDEGYTYYFTDGNGGEDCDKVKIESGDLNDVVIITYHDGSSTWSYGLHFKWKNQPDHLILQEQNGTEYDYYTTNLNSALEMREKKVIHEY